MRVDLALETPISRTSRARQLEAIFDVPASERSKVEFHGDIDIESAPWSVGLIVGPSGSGKTRITEALFGNSEPLTWGSGSVIDDFPKDIGIQAITDACKAVGFNTIPAWLRPYAVLSNGEKFRVEMARHLLAPADPIIVDEFTSVVDRQVAQIGSYAVAKYVRRAEKKFIAVSCHYDIIDWLEPDWIFEPATWTLTRRSLRGRPPLEITVGPVPIASWKVFGKFHYLTNALHPAASCFGLWVNGALASFAAYLRRPHATQKHIMGCSRLVTLPDWQGLGLGFVLGETMAKMYKSIGEIVHNYPATPSHARDYKYPKWEMRKRIGTFATVLTGPNSSIGPKKHNHTDQVGGFGGRPCGVYRWIGDSWPDKQEAANVISGEKALRREWSQVFGGI